MPVIFLSICNHWKQELRMIIQGRACEDLFLSRTQYYDATIVANARCKLSKDKVYEVYTCLGLVGAWYPLELELPVSSWSR